jgi:hypothetical protein
LFLSTAPTLLMVRKSTMTTTMYRKTHKATNGTSAAPNDAPPGQYLHVFPTLT